MISAVGKWFAMVASINVSFILIPMDPRATLQQFDSFLAARGLLFDAVVVGGTALNLLGIISRPTRDCDVIHPAIPAPVLNAAQQFAAARRANGEELDDNWLNNGPSDLTRVLGAGWEARTVVAFVGSAMVLRVLERGDLLKTKLFALCDRATDLQDCVALKPTAEELADALLWVQAQDTNDEWPTHVRATFASLSRKVGHVRTQ